MTPLELAILRAAPGSRDQLASRLPAIRDAAKVDDIPAAAVAMERLVGMGLVEVTKVTRDTLYSRTREGDRVARTGRFE